MIALTLDWDVGFVAVTIAVILSLLMPHATKGAAEKVAWPTVLLICGIVTYVALLQEMGTIDWLGEEVAGIGTPLLAALVICFIGGAVSAFASTTGILGALIPLAVPFLAQGQIGAVGVIIALSIASSVVDSSPFSTSGALVVANSPDDRRDFVYKKLLQLGHEHDHHRAGHGVGDLRAARLALKRTGRLAVAAAEGGERERELVRVAGLRRRLRFSRPA